MKKITSFALLFSLAVVVTLFMANKNKPEGKTESTENEKESIQDAFDYLNMLRNDPVTGCIDPVLYYQARADVKNEMLNGTRSISPVWEEMGPDNIGGRCRAIMYDKADASNMHMFAGSVSGGLFESHNGGESWDRCSFSDNLSSMNVTCFAQAANGDIYFGTGESFGGAGGSVVDGVIGFPGDGIFKSTDHGAIFTNVLSASALGTGAINAFINSMAADPTDANKIYAATNSGVKITTNGGGTWTVVNGLSASSGDVEIGNDGTVHAVVGTKYWRKRPSDLNFIQATTVTAPGFPQGQIARLNMAVCAGNPNYVYAIASKAGGILLGVWKSIDGGSSWSQIAGASTGGTPPSTWMPVTQGDYALAIGVHPTNPDIVFIGGLDVYRFTPTGGWDKISVWYYPTYWSQYVHADLHTFAFDPGHPNSMFTGSDGGMSKTLDCTAQVPAFDTKNKGFAVTQFYSCTGIPYEGSVLAGAQDNGTMLRDLTLTLGQNTPHQFNVVKGGDGGDVATSRLNHNVIFGEYVNGAIERSANKGQSFAGFFDTHIDSDGDGYPMGTVNAPGAPFISACALWEKPGADTITNRTHKFFLGVDAGVWMTNNALLTSQNTIWFKLNKTNTSNVISLAVADDGNCVYAGCRDGKVYRISGLDTTYAYTGVVPAFHPDSVGIITTLIETLPGAVTGLAVDPTNMHHVVATVGGYSGSHVFESMDADTAANPIFNNIQGTLTQMPVYSVAIANSTTIIVGTELGVWSRQAGVWSNVNDGVLPNVPTLKLRWVATDPWNGSWLYASTYGRGVFRTSYFAPNVGVTNPNADKVSGIEIYPNPVSTQTTISINLDKPGDVIGSVYDLSGKMVARFYIKGVDGLNKRMIDVADLSNGTYIISMQTAAGALNKKMIVVK